MKNIPLIDGFETRLAEPYNGSAGTIKLEETPQIELEPEQTLILTIDAKIDGLEQAVEIDGINHITKECSVSNTSVKKGQGLLYQETAHLKNASVVIANNYQYFENIRTSFQDLETKKLTKSDYEAGKTLSIPGAIDVSEGINTSDITLSGNSTNTAGGLAVVGADGKLAPSLLSSPTVGNLQKSYIAGENIAAGQAVRMGITGEDINKVYVAKADDTEKMKVIGVAHSSANLDESLNIIFDGVAGGYGSLLSEYVGDITSTIEQPNIYQSTNNWNTTARQSFTITKKTKLKEFNLGNMYVGGHIGTGLTMKIYENETENLIGISTTTFNLYSGTNNNIHTLFDLPLNPGVYEVRFYNGATELQNGNLGWDIYSNSSQYSGGQMYMNGVAYPTRGMRFTLTKQDYVNVQLSDPAYLQDNGSISYAPGTNSMIIGAIQSDTEILLSPYRNTSTSATTGSLALGNAEGYVSVDIPGIGMKKIPYYGV